jgi:hypothetical protein
MRAKDGRTATPFQTFLVSRAATKVSTSSRRFRFLCNRRIRSSPKAMAMDSLYIHVRVLRSFGLEGFSRRGKNRLESWIQFYQLKLCREVYAVCASNGQAARQEPVIKTKTGLISQGVTKKPGEFSNWYISRIS